LRPGRRANHLAGDPAYARGTGRNPRTEAGKATPYERFGRPLIDAIRRVPKTIFGAAGKRRASFHERDDGRFGFVEEKRATTYDGDRAWSPVPSPSPICGNADIAKYEARARIEWRAPMKPVGETGDD